MSVDTREVERALGRWAAALQMSVPNAIRVQAGRILSDAIRYVTPPKTKRQGRDRVRLDIDRAVQLIDPDKHVQSAHIRDLIDRGHYDLAAKLFTHGKKTHLANYSDFKRVHGAARDRRGRVHYKKGRHVTFLKDDWWAYVRKRQKAVGMAKAGWVKAFDFVRRRVQRDRLTLSRGRSAAVKDIPRWIRAPGEHKHVSDVKDTLNMWRQHGSIIAVNTSPWAARNDARALQWVMDRRLRAIRNEVQAVMAKEARRKGL